MYGTQHLRLTVVLFVSLAILGATTCLSGQVFAAEKPALANSDCIKCHEKPPADIEAKGGAHKTSVGCQDCHVGHPPAVKKPIPQCSMCHSDKPHFKLAGCNNCHKNPHTPKEIKFGNNVTDACLSCHTQQIAKLRENKSKHSPLACSFCHNEHGKVPPCTQCHKPKAPATGTFYHAAEITQAECKKCHQAHMPLVVTYGNETPSKYCAACHKQAYDLLVASKAKHSKLLCVSCHKAKHKAIAKCQECHGTPHPAGLLAKFPKCGDCHNIAHDLNNWPSGGAAPVKQEPAKKAPAKKGQ